MEIENKVCQLTSRLITTFSQKCIKKIRTKRRRIRSYFGGVANIASIDFTIGSERISKTVIGGYFLKINAQRDLKALINASEGYCLDQTCSHILSPVFYALTYLYCLHLSHVPVTLYITHPQVLEMCQNLKTIAMDKDDPIEQSVKLMLHHLINVEFMPCVKGPFFERMRNKIDQMKHGMTNELVTFDFQAATDTFLKPPASTFYDAIYLR